MFYNIVWFIIYIILWTIGELGTIISIVILDLRLFLLFGAIWSCAFLMGYFKPSGA
jgi:hypothetical protein